MLKIRQGVVVVGLGKIRKADIIETKALAAFVTQVTRQLKRLLEETERLVVMAEVKVEATQIEQCRSHAILVADFLPNLQGLLVIFLGLLGFSVVLLNLGHHVKRHADAALVAEPLPNIERLLKVTERLVLLVELAIANADPLKDGAFGLIVSKLNGERKARLK